MCEAAFRQPRWPGQKSNDARGSRWVKFLLTIRRWGVVFCLLRRLLLMETIVSTILWLETATAQNIVGQCCWGKLLICFGLDINAFWVYWEETGRVSETLTTLAHLLNLETLMSCETQSAENASGCVWLSLEMPLERPRAPEPPQTRIKN